MLDKEYEFHLEVCGYSGRLIDDHTFKSRSEAKSYFIDNYGGDGGISYELFAVDKNGNRKLLES